MSDGKTSSSSSAGLGLLGGMLILAYGPLDWTFPKWLWALALAGPIFGAMILTAFAGFMALLLKKRG